MDAIAIKGYTITEKYYDELANPFNTVFDSADTSEQGAEGDDLNIYKLSVAQFKTNTFANDSQFPYQEQEVTINSPCLSIAAYSITKTS